MSMYITGDVPTALEVHQNNCIGFLKYIWPHGQDVQPEMDRCSRSMYIERCRDDVHHPINLVNVHRAMHLMYTMFPR